MVRRLAGVAVLALLGPSGCLKDNPVFIEPTAGSASGSGSTSAMATATTAAASGSTAAPMCEPDGFEDDDDSETSPPDLGNFTAGIMEMRSATAEPGDDDWFSFRVNDPGDPTVTLSIDEPSLELCVFAFCSSGGLTLDCRSGDRSTSPEGRSGCCSNDQVAFGHTCSDGSSTVRAFARIAGAAMCVPYTVQLAT